LLSSFKMTVTILLYLPIDQKTPEEPQIDRDLQALVQIMNGEEKKDEEEEADDDNNGYRGRNSNPKWTAAVKKVHKDWIDVLAFSYGCSTSHLQDLSLTKWCDRLTPIVNEMVLASEKIPFAVLRTISELKTGKPIQVQQVVLTHASISSLSSGGSGGEDNLTENMTLSGKIFNNEIIKADPITGERIANEGSFGVWDTLKKKGNRTRLNADAQVSSLLELSKQKVLTGALSTDDKQKLEQSNTISEYDQDEDALETQRSLSMERTFWFSTSVESKKYKRIEIKDLTKESLWNAVAQKLDKPASAIKSICGELKDGAYEELVDDSDVKFMVKSSGVKYMLVEL